jgi:hypothetical protein
MRRIVALITVSLAVLSRERLRHVARWRRGAGPLLIDQELRLARLQLPPGWRPAHDLNEGATLQAINPAHGRHVIVISESLEDYPPDVTVHEHARITVDLLIRGIKVVHISGPHHRSFDGHAGVQYEIEGFHENTWVKYLHTTISGRRAFHQIIGWATQSRYSRDAFDALLDGFQEEAGPDPVRRAPPDGFAAAMRPTSSRVH